MTEQEIDTAARLLAAARQSGDRLDTLPVGPKTADEAHAIQDRVTALLGEQVAAYKANAPAHDEPTRAPIYARMIRQSPAEIGAEETPDLGVEGEIAFHFTRDLGPRSAPYTRTEVAACVEACAAIEVVSSRFRDPSSCSSLAKLADCISNGAFVPGAGNAEWADLDLNRLHVTLLVNGAPVVDQVGGHPSGDPLGVAVALVDLMRNGPGIRAGQYVTTGSCTGLRFLSAGDRCEVAFERLGRAELVFA